ncbi:hypothetical protein MA13_contig00005-0193 [Edwardsiella piscicida]|nr:hypothetical protein MA13_contig00005-0193 [Edwardsiella piscicida]
MGDVIDDRSDEQWLKEIFRYSSHSAAGRALGCPASYRLPLGITVQGAIQPPHIIAPTDYIARARRARQSTTLNA